MTILLLSKFEIVRDVKLKNFHVKLFMKCKSCRAIKMKNIETFQYQIIYIDFQGI